MKKMALLAASLIFGLTACQNDELVPSAKIGSQTITVAIPQNGVSTRATAADFGGGMKVNRCILEIYHDGELYGERKTAVVTDGKATFDLRLVASQEYDFVFWADCADGNADLHYNTTDLKNITRMDGYEGNNDEFDAFFGYENGYEVSETFKLEKTLKRPFGQLNVKTLDMESIFKEELKPASVTMTFKALPTSFNALNGEVGAETAEVAYTAAVINATDGELTMDYIWAVPGENATLVDFTMKYLNSQNAEITTNDNIKNIPLRRNYKTNVSGNLLTKQGTVDVTIDPIWDGETPVVVNGALNVTTGKKYTNLQDAIDAADAGEVIRIWGVLDEDIVINKDLTLEGGSDDASAARVRSLELAAGINVTCENVEFFGSRDFWGESYGAYVAQVKSATFKNCCFTQNPEEVLALATVYNATGKLMFDGCFFGAQPMFQQLAQGGSLTIQNSDFEAWGAQIEPANYINHTIKGNTFKTVHFTAQSGATNVAGLSSAEKLLVNELLANNTFVDDTKKVKVWATGFYVNNILPAVYNQTTGQGYSTLTEALTAAQANNVILVSSMNSNENLYIPANVTLDGCGTSQFIGKLFVAQGATLRNLVSEWNGVGTRQAIMVQGSNVTLENLTVTYKGAETKAEAIVTSAGAENLTVKGCKFSGYWKGLYLNSTKGLKIEGCDFKNMNPFSMDEYDASMQVTGNTFRRSSIWDSQMSHFIITEGMDDSTRYAESWSLDLKNDVYALFKENTWVGNPRIRVQYTGTKAWDNTNVTPAIFNTGNLNNAHNVFTKGDRYQPSAVEFLSEAYEGKSNVLHYTLDSRTSQTRREAAYKGHFYNTQGRHFEVFNPAHLTKWEVSGQIYVDAQMITSEKPFRSELWTVSRNATTNGEEYPMLGIANVVENAGGIYQSTMDHAVVRIWGDNGWANVEGVAVEAGWHTVKMVSDGTNVTYYFDNQEVGKYTTESTPIYMFSVMPQAFHYDYQHTDGRWFYQDYTCETYFCDIKYKLTE